MGDHFKEHGKPPGYRKGQSAKGVCKQWQRKFRRTHEWVQDASLFLMPGGQTVLYGDVPESDHVPLRLILEGKATITDSIRISYELSKAAWWKSNYFYLAKLEYHGGAGRRYFTSTVVDAD